MRTPYVPHVFGEEVKRKLRSRIGWLSAAVASSIPWPKKDVWIRYAEDDFILRGTENGQQPTAPAVTVPGTSQQIEEGLAKVYRLTSVLGWFLNGYVDVVETIQGSHPMGFGAQMRQAYSEVGQFGDRSFDCNHMPIIESENVRIALAFWREGQRLTRVHDSYAFLSYFKVIESQYQQGADRADWFARHVDLMTGEAGARVAQLRADGMDVGRHLYDSGRNAVAHASFGGGIVDPDIPADRRRIAADLVLMRELARHYIASDLKVPTARELYRTRNRIEPWEPLIDERALAVFKAGGTPEGEFGLDGLVVALNLWPDSPMPGLSRLIMRVDAVHEGAARVLLFNDRMTMVFAFVIDFRKGQIHTQLDNSGLLQNDEHRPIEEDVREFYTVFHRVIGNAVVELRIEGREPVDCEVVIPVNILPRNPEEAVAEAVEAFRRANAQKPE
ncbi:MULTISPECIES: methylamine utilization protein MauJ [Stenotrophomonas]|uniref:methylamine utilization protein MauJ n=1 Tax=Stenotrophomonas TaxID=40323 RepID=UPI00159F5B03|nr:MULTISPECIES: methylamine utilization protein MauJ [Stenotrophomonas]